MSISLSDVVDEFAGRAPEHGPYSFSRLEGCDFAFKQKYINERRPVELTRWGRNEGSAAHDLVEYDVERQLIEGKDPLEAEEAVDTFLEDHPEYNDFRGYLEQALRTFRSNFELAEPHYLGSEEKLGMNLTGDPVGFGDEMCWYRGIADYIEVDDGGHARIVDFKNRPKPHKWRKLRSTKSDISRQIIGYAMLAMIAYPSIEQVTCEVYYFQTGQTRYIHRKTDSGEYERRYLSREEIESRHLPLIQRKMLAKERQSTFPPQPNRKRCQYCGFVDICPKWDEGDLDREFVVRDEDEAREYLEKLVVLKELRKRIDGALKSWVKQKGSVETDQGAYYGYDEKTRLRPKTGDLFRKIAEHFDLESEDLETFIEIVEGDIRLTKGKATSFVDSLPEEVRDELYEEGFTSKETTRKTKSF